MTNYTIIDNALITSNITNGAYRLYVMLQSMCYGDKVECYPSQQYLAEKLNKSVRTIQRYLNELIGLGVIKKKRRGSISNVYTVVSKILEHNIEKAIVESVKKVKKTYKTYKNKKQDSFNNFEQRNYNFAKLEAALLGNANYEYEELLE